MSQHPTPQQALFDRIASPEGLPIIQFQNGDSISLIRSQDATVFTITAKPRIEGASPIHLGTIVFNDSFPRIQPHHLQAILDFIQANN